MNRDRNWAHFWLEKRIHEESAIAYTPGFDVAL